MGFLRSKVGAVVRLCGTWRWSGWRTWLGVYKFRVSLAAISDFKVLVCKSLYCLHLSAVIVEGCFHCHWSLKLWPFFHVVPSMWFAFKRSCPDFIGWLVFRFLFWCHVWQSGVVLFCSFAKVACSVRRCWGLLLFSSCSGSC